TLLFDAEFVSQVQSYRARRFPWVGLPKTVPDIAVEPNAFGGTTVYASWNGATRASHWRVVGGGSARQMQPLTTVARSGFETAIPVKAGSGSFAVEALDTSGTRLARSAVVSV
ncbi:MAG: hypothetical protein JOY68_04110, partial [Candidatus Dormibacteraeota bacterium]|nr:hypothetical protein [Candidatus Dormibacteraeota bacterium]